MNKNEMQRLIKVEQRIYELADEAGLEYCDIEFDIIPDQKMLEMMAYRIPSNISNWKYGRDYERLRTIQERVHSGLPYEVVINSDPSRAYLMKNNVFAVQALVMAHVVGHVAFFTMNRYFQRTDRDIVQILLEAGKRFEGYEKLYGIDTVERIVDAGHAIQFHSSPWDTETEEDKRERVYEQMRKKRVTTGRAEFDDISPSESHDPNINIALMNRQLWQKLKETTPVEPTEDLLRYIIDNSTKLDRWEKDILEILRKEGQYFWPQMKTKYMNEGFATYWHERIMNQLFHEGLLTKGEHAQYNYTNSLVKAANRFSLNPYLMGSEMWKNIVMRWDKGRHGIEYDACDNANIRDDWDDGSMRGHEKMFEIVRTYTDWMFMKSFLTPELINELNLYIYVVKDTGFTEDIIITRQKAKKIAELISRTFTHSGIPKIEVINGNYKESGYLLLCHAWAGANLEREYAMKTLQHIANLWGKNCYLRTKLNEEKVIYYKVEKIKKSQSRPVPTGTKLNDVWST